MGEGGLGRTGEDHSAEDGARPAQGEGEGAEGARRKGKEAQAGPEGFWGWRLGGLGSRRRPPAALALTGAAAPAGAPAPTAASALTAAAAPAAASAPTAVQVPPDDAALPQVGDTVQLRVRKQQLKHKYNGFTTVVTDASLCAVLSVQFLESPAKGIVYRIPRAQAELVFRASPKDTATEIGNGVVAPATPAAPAVVAADATAATEAAAGGGAALATSAGGAAQEVMATGAAAVVASASGAPQDAPDAVAPAALDIQATLADFSNYESDNGEEEIP